MRGKITLKEVSNVNRLHDQFVISFDHYVSLNTEAVQLAVSAEPGENSRGDLN
jgi:hypothetical protein